jgi:hypothetical protein
MACDGVKSSFSQTQTLLRLELPSETVEATVLSPLAAVQRDLHLLLSGNRGGA